MSHCKHVAKFALTCVFVTSLATAAHAASTVYVGSCGTHDFPTGNIQTAVSDAVSGDTIIVCAGTYKQNVNVETSGLTIITHGTVTLEPGNRSLPGFKLNAGHTTIEGFQITGFSTGIAVEAGVGNETINGNTIHGNGTGIALNSSSGRNTVEFNNVNNNSGDGIYDFSSGSADVIDNNSVQYNGSGTKTPGGNSGIEISSTANAASILNNVANYNKGDGIYLNNASNGNTENNQFNNNDINGLELNASNGNDVEVSFAGSNGANGIEVHSNSSANVLIDNLTFGNAGNLAGSQNFDATDHSTGTKTAGTGNLWVAPNNCVTQSPQGICTVP